MEILIAIFVLTAHVNGRKHREALIQTKEDPHISVAGKRKMLENDESAVGDDSAYSYVSKKSRIDQRDFNGEDTYKANTERTVSIENENRRHLHGENKLIDGLPRGFFDDDGMNNRVRETVEKEKQINSELERFYNEVEEFEEQKDDEQTSMVSFENSTVGNDIDEQIERWKTINELEKRKESIIEFASANSGHTSNFDSLDDTELDFSFDSIDWRTKNL
uniref:Seminal fluid protein n=1 Tax=Meloidogyne hapla TaxID=6305 RepID=A0A1I8BSM0_MELHA